MISISALKPELDIPTEVWDVLEGNDFVNFSVPLLNPPEEAGGVLFWSGHRLMMVTGGLAAFESDEDAARYMPYGEMFKVVANHDETLFAQIYSIFFEKERDEWCMMYRLMNCGRAFSQTQRDDCSELPSNWMLSLSGVENWLTLDAYLNYYCKFESYDRSYVAGNIREQLCYMEGPDYDERDVRVMTQPGGVVVLVSRLTKGWALAVDIVKNARLARFVMDDPPHLVETFWRLNAKMLLNGRDRLEMEGMISDARHFAYAIKSAREQMLVEEDVTAAAFYL
ncbi:MAG: hypothetical protein LBF92_08685 [Synergistaceae bacterium]|nr:hypothetical protein [Synergistaceae bacterium]